MSDERLEREERVAVEAKNLGLEVDSIVGNEWEVMKGKERMGYLYYFDEHPGGPDEEYWLTAPTPPDCHQTLPEALATLEKMTRVAVFEVSLEFDKRFDAGKEEMNRVLELVLAAREALTPAGVTLKKVAVRGRGGLVEKVAKR